jgi:plasmid replication initiation protein
MGRELALELVRTSSGLTSLCWETLTAIRSPHALRLYEIASHWKDNETMAMSLEQFRRWMRLCDRFKENKELMRSVVRPAEKLLKKVSEVHVHCQPVKSGRRIVKMNLHIQHRRRREEEEIYHMRLREQIVNILRIRFRFKEEHFRSIEGVLRDNGKLRALNEKVGMLWGLLDNPSNQVRDETAWAVASIQSAFTM